MKLVSYLNFDGQCETAFKFYEKCFGGKITAIHTFGETPGCEQMPEEAKGQIMHARLEIGDAVLMASDSPSGMYEQPKGIWVSLHPETIAEAERIFAELSEGGNIVMPIGETFWAARFGMVNDRFGIPWMINCEKEA